MNQNIHEFEQDKLKKLQKTSKKTQNKYLTFATLLVLLCLIMCCHPAINAIPKITPIKIPEINPIFTEFSTATPERNEKEKNYKGTRTIRSQNKTTQIATKKRNPRTKLPEIWN